MHLCRSLRQFVNSRGYQWYLWLVAVLFHSFIHDGDGFGDVHYFDSIEYLRAGSDHVDVESRGSWCGFVTENDDVDGYECRSVRSSPPAAVAAAASDELFGEYCGGECGCRGCGSMSRSSEPWRPPRTYC